MRLTGRFLPGIIFLAITVSCAMAQDPPPGAAQEYQWSTYAGNPGGLGYLDGTGTAAQFAYPQAVAVDGSGNIYVADSANQVIREISQGVVVTIAGAVGKTGTANGPLTSARFDDPTGIAVDGSGNIYVADTGNNTVRLITSGTVSTLAGKPAISGTDDGLDKQARFHAPSGLAVDGSGNVFVADSGNNTIREIFLSGSVETIAGMPTFSGTDNGVGSVALFDRPTGLCYDSSLQVLFIADSGNDTIRALDVPSDYVSLFCGEPGQSGDSSGGPSITTFNNPTGIAVVNKEFFVADTGNDEIRALNFNGVSKPFVGRFNTPGSRDGDHFWAHFNSPMQLATDGSGNIYVADTKNSTIREVTLQGTVTTIAGSAPDIGYVNGPGLNALFAMPEAVAVDGSNNVFVTDTKNDVIRRVSSLGVVSKYSGQVGVTGTDDGTTTAQYDQPGGIAVDGSGNVYVADTDNDTIRMIDVTGNTTTIAGTPGVSGTDDGPGSTALFDHPHGLGVDSNGNIYVADTDNDTIRIISGGTVSTLAGVPEVSGTQDGPEAQAEFHAPMGLVVDGTNGLYVADTMNHTVRFISAADGSVSTFAGKPEHPGSANGIKKARFDFPTGIAVDNANSVFVTDAGDNTIRKITSKGVVSTIGGTAGLFGSTPGFGAVAEFAMPEGITSTQEGVLYVADTVNNRIAKGAHYGSVEVQIYPAGAAVQGRWFIDGGALMESGSTQSGLTAGTHTVHFTYASGYYRAPSFKFTVLSGTTVLETGTYGGIPVIQLQEPPGTALIKRSSVIPFGAIVSGSSISKTFDIVDVGTGPLSLDSVTFLGNSASRFSATTLPSLLQVGDTTSFTVSCSPDGFGPFATRMQVASSDPVTPDFVVKLMASGTNGPVNLVSSEGNLRALISVTGQTVDGFLSLTIGKNGVVTGSLILDGVTTKVKGAFGANGQFTGTPANLSLLLTSGAGGPTNPAGYQAIGTAGVVPVMAWHAAYTSKEAVTESPKYTILLDATTSAVTIPQGTGYLTLTVSAKGGTAKLSGKLADGTTVMYSGFVASGPNGHQVYVYDNSLNSKKGLFAGMLTFEHLLNSDADGMMEWVHPAVNGDLYPQAFNTLLNAGASKYIAPQKGSPALPIFTGTFSLSNGGLTATDNEAVILTTKNIVLFQGTNPNDIKVTIDAAKGSFSGSFIDPTSTKKVSFSGLLYQNAHIPGAEGYFIGPVISNTSLSGDVLLTQ
jgi:hypothetical protein